MRKYEKIEEEMDKRSEIVDRYYAIGEKLFSEPTCTEVRLTLELSTLCVAQRITDADNGLGIWAEVEGDDTGVISFLPEIDRNDAFRLAGLLMAWGDCERIHGKATA